MVQKKFCLSTFFSYFLFFLTFLGIATPLTAQNKLWTSVDKHLLATEKKEYLKTYQLFQLDESLFLEAIKPFFSSYRQVNPPISIHLPTHTFSKLDLVASPIVEASLAAKYVCVPAPSRWPLPVIIPHTREGGTEIRTTNKTNYTTHTISTRGTQTSLRNNRLAVS